MKKIIMFGFGCFAKLSISKIPFKMGAILADVDCQAFARAKLDFQSSYDCQIVMEPGKMVQIFVDNDTDFTVQNLKRGRDQSPINDASLYGTIVYGANNPAITNATNASPIVITSAAHGLTTGKQIFIDGVEGNTAANGLWTITVIDANTFSLNSSTGNGAFASSAAFWWLAVPGAAGIALTYQSGSNGNYIGTIPAGVPMPAGGSYFRFVTCTNYNINFGPTPVTAALRV